MTRERHSCTDCSQHHCFIANSCSEEWKQAVGEQKIIGFYQKGQAIFIENNLEFGAYFIYKGKVKIFNSGKQGRQHIIRFAAPGDVLGFKGYSDRNYSVSCIALEDTVICFLEKNFLFSVTKANPEFAIALIQYYARELAFLEFHQKNLVQFNVKNRVAEALLMIKKHFGATTDEGILLDVNLSQHDIGAIAGITTEHTNRCLSLFKKEKIIDYHGHKKIMLLNVDKLFEMILDNCCEKNMYINPRKCCEYLL